MPTINICNQRLVTQHLVTQRLEKASDVVQMLGAVQAQDYQGAKWALSQRARGLRDEEIEKELSDGAILRTHVLRPTWHFVTAGEIRWMLALTGPRVKALLGNYDRQLELDAKLLSRSRVLMMRALKGGKHLTRAELAKALQKGGVRSDGTQRLAHIVMHAELDGLICSGARRGKQFTYALLDERAPPTKDLSRDEALYALGMRYFATRGPATEDDFVWWSGLIKRDAKAFIESAGGALQSETIAGRVYWFVPPVVKAKIKSPLVHLLSNFDEYFIGLRDRSAIHNTLKASRVAASFNALSGHLITINGQLVGGWTRSFHGKAVAVALAPLTRLTGAEKLALNAQVARYADFLGMPLRE
jgi:hypothetical protein